MTLQGFWSETDLTPFSADNMNACLLQVGTGPPSSLLLGFEGQRYFDDVAKELYIDDGSWSKIIEADGNPNVPGLRSLTEDGGASPFNHIHIGGPSAYTGAITEEVQATVTSLESDVITDYPASPVNPWPTDVGSIELMTPNTTNVNTSKLAVVEVAQDSTPGGGSTGSSILDTSGLSRGWRIGASNALASHEGDNIRNATDFITVAAILNYNEQFVLRVYPVWNLPEVSVAGNTSWNLFYRFTYKMKVQELTTSLVF